MAAQRTLPARDSSRPDLSSVRLLKVPEAAPPFDGEALPTSTGPSTAGPTIAAITPVGPIPPGGPLWAPSAARPSAERRHAPAPPERAADAGWTRQFAQLLAETLAGVRPQRQFLPWLAGHAPAQLRRIAPGFGCGQRPQVLRVLADWPTDNVAELTVIVRLGPRTRALAARLEAVRPEAALRAKAALRAEAPVGAKAAAYPGKGARPGQPTRWLCTDIEAA
jgi:hypothetical protein